MGGICFRRGRIGGVASVPSQSLLMCRLERSLGCQWRGPDDGFSCAPLLCVLSEFLRDTWVVVPLCGCWTVTAGAFLVPSGSLLEGATVPDGMLRFNAQL